MIAEKDIEAKQLVANSLYEYTQQLEEALKEKWRVDYDQPLYMQGYMCCATLVRDVKILPPIVTKSQSPIKGAK